MKNRKTTILFIAAASVFILVFIAAISFGSVNLELSQILEGLTGKSETEKIIIRDIRLPRVLGSVVAGASLSAAGLILQCITNNSLCAPNIVGINSGAGFVVMLILCFTPSAWAIIPLGAFLGALATTLLIMAISFSGKFNRSGTTLVLAGIAVSSVLSAGISFLSLKYPEILSSYTAFSVGGFSGVQFKDIIIPSIISLTAIVLLQCISHKITLLSLGDEVASSLGLNIKILRIIAIILSSALCASAVSFAGLLGFVGLIVPHIARKLMGNDLRKTLPFTALCGASLTTLSDMLGRIFFTPSELPAGIIMSLVGAPFFLYLLIVRRNKIDQV